MFEEQLCVSGMISPSVASRIVLPARLDRVVRQVHLVVARHVLAENQCESVGKRLRVGSADAEHSRTEVLGSYGPVGQRLLAYGLKVVSIVPLSSCSSWCAAPRSWVSPAAARAAAPA